MKPLKKDTINKINLIKNFLKTEIGKLGIIVQSDWTLVYKIVDIDYNAVRINIWGESPQGTKYRDAILEESIIRKIFTECKKQDEDFRNFINENGGKLK